MPCYRNQVPAIGMPWQVHCHGPQLHLSCFVFPSLNTNPPLRLSLTPRTHAYVTACSWEQVATAPSVCFCHFLLQFWMRTNSQHTHTMFDTHAHLCLLCQHMYLSAAGCGWHQHLLHGQWPPAVRLGQAQGVGGQHHTPNTLGGPVRLERECLGGRRSDVKGADGACCPVRGLMSCICLPLVLNIFVELLQPNHELDAVKSSS